MVSRADLADTAEPVLLIPLGEITVAKDRLRSLKPADAAAFAVAMDVDGQYEPIAVTKLPGRADFELVDGLHRLEGARINHWASIEARIIGPDAAKRLRREVLSEWVRASSDVFDRAAQIKAVADEARRAGFTKPAGPDEVTACKTILQVLRWDEATAERLDISRQTVFAYLKIADAFPSDLVDRLRVVGHASQFAPLYLLARQEPRIVFKAIAHLEGAISGGRVVTIAEAIDHAKMARAKSPAEKRLNAVLGAAKRIPDDEKQGVFTSLVANHFDYFRRAVAEVEAGKARGNADE